MAHTSASPEPERSDAGTVWDHDINGEAFAGFDAPRTRPTPRDDATRRRAQARPAPRPPGPAPLDYERTEGGGWTVPAPAAPSLAAPVPIPGAGVPGRRTITIHGRGAERNLPPSRRRPTEPIHQRAGFKADRAALWAVVLGILLVVVAAASAHGAVLAHAVH